MYNIAQTFLYKNCAILLLTLYFRLVQYILYRHFIVALYVYKYPCLDCKRWLYRMDPNFWGAQFSWIRLPKNLLEIMFAVVRAKYNGRLADVMRDCRYGAASIQRWQTKTSTVNNCHVGSFQLLSLPMLCFLHLRSVGVPANAASLKSWSVTS